MQRKLGGVLDAIADGFRAPGLRQKLAELKNCKVTLQRRLERVPASVPPGLHPNLAADDRKGVARLHQAMMAGEIAPRRLPAGFRH